MFFTKMGILSKLNGAKPKTSMYFKVESIAVGVEIKMITRIVKAWRINLLKIKTPRVDPPKFSHIISIGSLAILTMRTYSLFRP